MSENFAQLLEESFAGKRMRTGSIVSARVVRVDHDVVVVDAGLKSEGMIPVEQFYNEQGAIEVNVGDQVDVALDNIEDGFGLTRLSREKAKRDQSWTKLERVFEAGEKVTG
ncbi:MAG: S1 RNA-binding domain-containing protein, partial [Gammaproteobacteria bacterium]|nr:S1 RNA-binding domain-containing protein [Gammaproteobacteria bacterium]